MKALCRVLEVLCGNEYVPVGVVVCMNSAGPFGTTYVRRMGDCDDLPAVVIAADLAIFDQIHAPNANLSSFAVAPETYGKHFRLLPTAELEVNGDEEDAVDSAAHQFVLGHRYYDDKNECVWKREELARLAA